MKKYLFILLFSVSFFFLSTDTSFGIELYSNLGVGGAPSYFQGFGARDNASCSTGSQAGCNVIASNFTFSGSTGSVATNTVILVRGVTHAIPYDFWFELWKSPSSDFNSDRTFIDKTFATSSSSFLNGVNYTLELEFINQNIELVNGQQYWIVVRSPASQSTTNTLLLGECNSVGSCNGRIQGALYNPFSFSGTFNTQFSDLKLKFAVFGSNSPINPPSTDFVDLVFPEDGSQLNDFINFRADFDLATTTSLNQFSLCVQYGTTTAMQYQSCEPIVSYSASGQPISNSLTLPIGNYFAQAYIQRQLCSLTGSCSIDYTVAISDIISYELLTSGDKTFGDPDLDDWYFGTGTVDFLPDVDCSGLTGIDFVWCSAVKFVFSLPNLFKDMFIAGYKGISNFITSIFPLNVFIAFNNAIDSAQATTTMTTVSLVGSGAIFGGKTFVLLDGNTTQWIEDAGFDYKTFIDYILYLIAGFIIIIESAHVVRSLKSHRSQKV